MLASHANAASPLTLALLLPLRAGLSVRWCKDPDRGLPAPDKILFLDISVEDAMKVRARIVASVVCSLLETKWHGDFVVV